MGGMGSGRHGRRSNRLQIEDVAMVLVASRLQAEYRAYDSTAKLPDTATCELDPGGSFPLRLTTTPQHLGGYRLWFLCPRCGKRKAKLYVHPYQLSPIACRTCHRLTYYSQSLARVERWDLRALRFARRVSWTSEDDGWRYKIRYKHWSTFNMVMDHVELYEKASAGHALREFQMLIDRWEKRQISS